MKTTEIDFVLGLTERDAKNIVAKAYAEAQMGSTWHRNTESWRAYEDAIKLMQRYVQEVPDHKLTLQNIQFYFYGK